MGLSSTLRTSRGRSRIQTEFKGLSTEEGVNGVARKTKTDNTKKIARAVGLLALGVLALVGAVALTVATGGITAVGIGAGILALGGLITGTGSIVGLVDLFKERAEIDKVAETMIRDIQYTTEIYV